MAHFHFPVQNQIAHSTDEEGRDLTDLAAAQAEARRAAGEILMAELSDREEVQFTIFIEDEERRRLLAIRVNAQSERLKD